ncbi:neurogenic protein mastermind-like isoform X2 [Photinus pyralis]|uniref:neurogenic protein mastermind-like isoform X2 n=1 Tax=Photinus pyralis TaxID=7054 RepID=UPI0012676F84|nr:neurogenic protein mastermind-like isoform X2 [Photinus pyralis]
MQQQKFLKRSAEDHDSGVPNDGFEPPVKLQCTTQHGTTAHQPEGLTKFSVEIVQQLEFTTSAANSQPQQISTNVTVKALTNASVKSDVSSPKSSNPSTPASNIRPSSGVGSSVDIGTLVECVKQEPDNDFADLDQCAAALEKDAAVNGGSAFGSFPDLIGEDPDDEIITSDAFKDLISDISNYPEFMKDFDFDESKTETCLIINGLKVEESKELTQNVLDHTKNTHSPLLQNQNYSPPIFEGQGNISKSRMSYSNIDFGKTELSPAAQTLKQMAEQHQHKNQMGLSFNPNTRVPNPRSPYPDFQFQGDYGSPTSNSSYKNSPSFQPEIIKQEMIYQGNEYDMKRKGAGMYKQQYSPYGSPSASGHGSPGYLPRNSGGGGSTPGSGAFGGGTPPRPSSGPGGNGSGTTLQINQAQQLHISQQGQGHSIQQQKFLKRSAEDHDSGVPNDGFEPPVKLQCTTQHGTTAHQPEGLTKFSVEIVQQLEFTTSAANSQPQQISTNVTVKALTNASVKSDVSSPKSSNPSTPASNIRPSSGVGSSVDIGTLVECVKQEPDNDFADLDQCAAALEKDAAVNGGSAFGSFPDLIGEDPDDEIITSDAFKDLISDISNYPEFMKDFDFDESKTETCLIINGLKVEESKELTQNVLDHTKNTHSPLLQNQNYSPPIFEGQGNISKSRMSYSNIDFGKTELSPAAQTLKQMAEQHQHKNQMGLSFNPNTRVPNPRSPYPDFQFQGDYGSPTSNSSYKNSPSFQPEIIKQEMIYQGNEYDMKRKGAGMYKQQYSPYGSPSASGHGSPGYLPRNSGGGGSTPGSGAFGGGTPPRPSSGPGGNGSGTTLQINQAQQLHISQQGQGHSIQVGGFSLITNIQQCFQIL